MLQFKQVQEDLGKAQQDKTMLRKQKVSLEDELERLRADADNERKVLLN